MLESKADFARRMGWNRGTPTIYEKRGKIVVDKATGKVDVEASMERLKVTADLMKEGVRQRHAQGRQQHEPGGDEETLRVQPNDTAYQLLTKHRAAREAEEAAMARMEREEKEGLLVNTEAVRKRALQTARGARDAVMNLRYRIDPLLAGEVDPVKRAEIWDRELRLICEEISRGTASATDVGAAPE